MSDYIIRFENFNFFYYKTLTLYNINLKFKAHKITAILGPSGSGKSTLLRSMNRIYELYPKLSCTGEIYYEDKSIFKDCNVNDLRKEIGMVFQKPTVFPMSIFDNIAYAIRVHEKISRSEMAERVEESLKKAALWDEVKYKLHDAGSHLSGGQQQRLCIARTIAIKPKVLLLDEPTSALDPVASAKIDSLIMQLREDYTVIMVTHKLSQARERADEIVFIKNGHIIETGDTQSIFRNPQQKETADYIQTEKL